MGDCMRGVGIVAVFIVVGAGVGAGLPGAEPPAQDPVLELRWGPGGVEVRWTTTAPEHIGECGGFAPVVDHCTSGAHHISQYFGLSSLRLPVCGASYGVPQVVPRPLDCFNGDFQAALTHTDGEIRALCANIMVVAGFAPHTPPRCTSSLTGSYPMWGVTAEHRCWARLENSVDNTVAGSGLPGAVGEWRCGFWHT